MLDQYEAHLKDSVHVAALEKKFILLIVPGGLTGEVQVCDTHLIQSDLQEIRGSMVVETAVLAQRFETQQTRRR